MLCRSVIWKNGVSNKAVHKTLRFGDKNKGQPVALARQSCIFSENS